MKSFTKRNEWFRADSLFKSLYCIFHKYFLQKWKNIEEIITMFLLPNKRHEYVTKFRNWLSVQMYAFELNEDLLTP